MKKNDDEMSVRSVRSNRSHHSSRNIHMKKLDTIYKTNFTSPLNVINTQQYRDYLDRTRGFQLRSGTPGKNLSKVTQAQREQF